MQLRQKLKTQTEEVTQLQSKLGSAHSEHQKEVSPYPSSTSRCGDGALISGQKDTLITEVQSLSEQISTLSISLQSSQSTSSELESLKSQLEVEQKKLVSTQADSDALADVRAELGKLKAEMEESDSKHREELQRLTTERETVLSSRADELSSLKKELDELKTGSKTASETHEKELKELKQKHDIMVVDDV